MRLLTTIWASTTGMHCCIMRRRKCSKSRANKIYKPQSNAMTISFLVGGLCVSTINSFLPYSWFLSGLSNSEPLDESRSHSRESPLSTWVHIFHPVIVIFGFKVVVARTSGQVARINSTMDWLLGILLQWVTVLLMVQLERCFGKRCSTRASTIQLLWLLRFPIVVVVVVSNGMNYNIVSAQSNWLTDMHLGDPISHADCLQQSWLGAINKWTSWQRGKSQ